MRKIILLSTIAAGFVLRAPHASAENEQPVPAPAESEAAPQPPTPESHSATARQPGETVTMAQSDSAATIFSQYDAHATTMRRARYARAIGFGVLGAGAVITGAAGLPEDPFARSYILVVGAGALAAGLFNLTIPSAAESTARAVRRGKCCQDAAELRTRWTMQAHRAQVARTAYGTISAVFGAANIALGTVALASHDPSLAEPDRANLAAFGFIAGAAGLAGAAFFFVMPTAPEKALAQYEATQTGFLSPRLSVLPIPGGAAAFLGATF